MRSVGRGRERWAPGQRSPSLAELPPAENVHRTEKSVSASAHSGAVGAGRRTGATRSSLSRPPSGRSESRFSVPAGDPPRRPLAAPGPDRPAVSARAHTFLGPVDIFGRQAPQGMANAVPGPIALFHVRRTAYT